MLLRRLASGRGVPAGARRLLGRGRRDGARGRLRELERGLRGPRGRRCADPARGRRTEGSMTGAPTFVLCIENNAIRAQALLLCESIRRYGGRHSGAPILAVAPRPGLGVDGDTRRRLDAMGVEYAEEPLNRACPEYGSANRVFAAAWAERRSQSEWLVVLDSDPVFLDELEEPADADAAVRPVDIKGSATEAPGDVREEYWRRLA